MRSRELGFVIRHHTRSCELSDAAPIGLGLLIFILEPHRVTSVFHSKALFRKRSYLVEIFPLNAARVVILNR